jgi:TonB family protein
MLALRALAGLALAPSLAAVAIGGAPLAVLDRAPPRAEVPRAEVQVSFDAAGRVAAAALLRSSGSRARDAKAREAAEELARLDPASGSTRVFHVAFAE